MQERRATPWAGTSLSPPVLSPALRACVVPALRACACPRAARARTVLCALRAKTHYKYKSKILYG